MNIRFVTTKDATDLLHIYNQYIDTPITFEYTLPSKEEFESRIKEISKDYPYIVCEENNKIIGYAYAHRHMERAAYQWNAELSIYLDKTYSSKGIGKKLYYILMEILKLQEVKTVYGCVTHPNEKSENLHKSMGFKVIGLYKDAGYKDGKWHDVQWFEKSISPHNINPKLFKSISEIPKDKIENIIKEINL